LLWSALQARQGFFNDYAPAAYLTDFLLNVVAILFATTLYSSNTVLLNLLLVSPAALLHILPPALGNHERFAKPRATKQQDEKLEDQEKSDPLPVRPFITAYRGGMIIVTCLAILAVDFRVFPRRFAKVENWGTSLMDMGVGSFVFSTGLVSSRSVLQARLAGNHPSPGNLLHSSLRSSVPLLVLGFIRLYSVKGLDYAEHVTEYGVHWNFFFTLALLPPFVACFQSVSAGKYSTALLSIVCSVTYEAALDFTRLKAYILTAPRADLLSQNREGVFSFCGYLAIFLAGQAIGFSLFVREQSFAPTEQRKRMVWRLIGSTSVWIALFVFATSYKYGLGLRVSRRLANLPYVLWVAAFNSAQITVYCLVETLIFPAVYLAADAMVEKKESKKATSRVAHAFNRNGLAIFLLANLLTGLINLILDTLTIGRLEAMAILVAYAGLLTAVVMALDSWNVSLKL